MITTKHSTHTKLFPTSKMYVIMLIFMRNFLSFDLHAFSNLVNSETITKKWHQVETHLSINGVVLLFGGYLLLYITQKKKNAKSAIFGVFIIIFSILHKNAFSPRCPLKKNLVQINFRSGKMIFDPNLLNIFRKVLL